MDCGTGERAMEKNFDALKGLTKHQPIAQRAAGTHAALAASTE
jgi:hypothetical protein